MAGRPRKNQVKEKPMDSIESLIDIEVDTDEVDTEDMPEVKVNRKATTDGMITVKMCHPGNLIFTLAGRKFEMTGSNADLYKASQTQGGMALKIGDFGNTLVPRNVWAEIVEKYGKTDMFKNGLIHGHEDADYMDSWVQERCKDVRHGLDPINPEKTRTFKKDLANLDD